MVRKKLILVPSDRMCSNKKANRNEHSLIRMSKSARINMGFDNSVEVYPNTKNTEERIKGSMLLAIFQAFSSDIKKLKIGGLSDEDIQRVGFVTTKTFHKVTGVATKQNDNIWITDSITDTVIGADPEFLLFNDDGGVVRANNILSYHGAVGSDGAMAEVRPKPAIQPEELVDNILALFKDKELVKPISQYNWVAGCYHRDNARDYPIGGHIHIGNPIKIASMPIEDRMHFFKSFNKILDEMLAIPMIKIDGSALGKARRTECTVGKFGYFGEFRTCNGRLEHRTLSGMWLMHPVLATQVFGCAKAIIDEVFRHVADNNYSTSYMFPTDLKNAQVWQPNFNRWAQIPLCNDLGCTQHSQKMIELLHKSAASKITPTYLKTWYSKMRKLSTYSQYAVYIDGLYEILKNNVETFTNFNKRIQSNWLEGAPFLQ